MAIFAKKIIHEKLNGFDEEIKYAEDMSYLKKGAKFSRFGILRSVPIVFSLRRFKKDGWINVCFKSFLCEIYLIFIGPIKSDFFKYRFDHYKNE